LKLLNSEKEEDFDMLSQTSPQMDKAVTIVKRLSADEQVRYDYEQAEKRRRDHMVIMNTAIREGEAIGIAKGKAEGEHQKAVSIARNLLSLNLPIDQIAQATGLTPHQIETL
jgi:predicted transposase/invertase (TIGR01784 family)